MTDKQTPPSKTRLIALKAYLRYSKPYRLRLLFVLFLFVTANILLAVIPIFIGKLVEVLSHSPVNSTEAWMYAWILVGLSSFHDLFWRGSEFAYRGLVNELNYRYETFLFRAVISKPYPYFVDKLSGKIGSYITTISGEFRNLLGNVLFDGTGQIIGIVTATAILGSLNWQSGVVFIGGIVGMVIMGRYTLRRNMIDEAKAADKNSTKNGILFDAIANYVSVKTLRTEPQEVAIIDREQTKTFHANQRAFLSGIMFFASMSFFVRHIIWATIVLMNIWFFLHGQLSIGGLATLFSTVLIFSSTIWAGVWYVSQLGQQMARVDEAYYYLFGDTPVIEQAPASRDMSLTLSDSIMLDAVSFAYPDKPDDLVLKSISLTIPKGQKIGIVGRSGSGKTTLTKLLLGFYEPSSGTIRVDGSHSVQLPSLLSFVPQDTSLFHRSIADNIAYGADESTQEKIEHVAKQAHADEFIMALPDGYNTSIGERGIKLSGGQRQRIAIARAMLHDRPVLVLDEATSALDSESEILIQKALDTLWRDKTVIAIAHRLSTLRHMDRIVVMDQGSIIEDGTHDELLAKNGVYAKLWNHQSGGFIEE